MMQLFIYTVLVTPFNMKGKTTQQEDGFDAAQSMHNGVLNQGGSRLAAWFMLLFYQPKTFLSIGWQGLGFCK